MGWITARSIYLVCSLDNNHPLSIFIVVSWQDHPIGSSSLLHNVFISLICILSGQMDAISWLLVVFIGTGAQLFIASE